MLIGLLNDCGWQEDQAVRGRVMSTLCQSRQIVVTLGHASCQILLVKVMDCPWNTQA